MTTSLTLSIAELRAIFVFVTSAFLIALLSAPLLTNFLYQNRMGKRLRQHGTDGKQTPIFHSLHGGKAGTPVMGGLLFWVTTAVITALFNLDRSETWLPLLTLTAAGLIGMLDDVLNVRGKGDNGGGIRLLHKVAVFTTVASVGAWWFYEKLGWNAIYIPGVGSEVTIGAWYVPLFIGAVVFTAFSMNQTDGLDGLAGGIAMIACFIFTLICLVQGKIHLALFTATLSGALLAFLWFNIYPARFFMGDTGSMALGMTLPIIAFLTNSVIVLPLLLAIPFLEGISTVIQIISKRYLKRKIFLIAPLHHHFEAVGWPETKVTMRFWVIAAVAAATGFVLMIVGGG
jgi:phospho-N-acetylmuramoyl-pentapeptide-transferase